MELNVREILKDASEKHASDIFLIGGLPLTYKIYGRLVKQDDKRPGPATLETAIKDLYQLAERKYTLNSEKMEDDFSLSLSGIARFRINTFMQRGTASAIIRILEFGIPSAEDMHIPESVLDIADLSTGMVLVTGPTGSGKSTTIACIIDKINHKYDKNIITLEDPIEYLHPHDNSIVIQREINTDTNNYLDALRSALRESPDVLFVGEMRDAETMSIAMTAAETGKLVISSLHTISAVDTIDRIIDGFNANQQQQIRMQLSRVLKYIVCQQLVTGVDGKLYPAFEIVKVTPAIANLIREGKAFQLTSFVQAGKNEGMCTMNDSLEKLVDEGYVDFEQALKYSDNKNLLKRHLENKK